MDGDRGQQISWLAARSITHKFIRLFDPSVAENPDDEQYVMSAFDMQHRTLNLILFT